MEQKEYSSTDEYFLKTTSLTSIGSEATSSRYSDLYVRLVGSGSQAVVLTESPPIHLRAHLSGDGEQLFTSKSHAGRRWGLCLDEQSETKVDAGIAEAPHLRKQLNRPAWAPVSIRESQGDHGFTLTTQDGGKTRRLVTTVAGAQGWMVCEWTYGHPQLFWLTEAWKGSLPTFCERVDLICVPVTSSMRVEQSHSSD